MARNPKPALFLSPDEQEQVKAAVAAAELLTSGEIRVYMEARIPWFRRDPYVRARQVFARLGMHATGERNGVLVYLPADDDDGNLANGTPNACRIWDAFNAHGIACGTRPTCTVP